MHEWERIRSLPSVEKLEKAWRILEEEVWSEKESVWEMNSCGQIERDRRNERRIMIEKYIEASVMLDSWGIGRCRGSCWGRCRGSGRQFWGIKKVSSNKESDSRTEARLIHQVSMSYLGGRSFLDRSTKYRGGVEIAFKKNTWEAWQIARYWGGVEIAFQNSFSRCERHRYECNSTYKSTNDPINTKISQNSLLIQKILSTRISKTHTHTHTH